MEYPSAPFSRGAMIGGEADVGGSGAETGSVIYGGAGNLDKSRDSGLLRDVVENILARLSSSLSSVDVDGRGRAPAQYLCSWSSSVSFPERSPFQKEKYILW